LAHCREENTFCGINPDAAGNEDSECMCKDGYRETGKSTCVLIASCPYHQEANNDHNQGGCPCAKQFCQKGICLCRPNYEYNRTTLQCEWTPDNHPEPDPDNGFCDHVQLTSALDSDDHSFALNLFHVIVILCLVGCIVALLFITAYRYWMRFKSQRNNAIQQAFQDKHEMDALNGH